MHTPSGDTWAALAYTPNFSWKLGVYARAAQLSPEGVCISAGRNSWALFNGSGSFPHFPGGNWVSTQWRPNGPQRVCAFRLDEIPGLNFIDAVCHVSIKKHGTHQHL